MFIRLYISHENGKLCMSEMSFSLEALERLLIFASSLEASERLSHCHKASMLFGGFERVYFAPRGSFPECS
jgi:hypothetical protein